MTNGVIWHQHRLGVIRRSVLEPITPYTQQTFVGLLLELLSRDDDSDKRGGWGGEIFVMCAA